MDWLKQEPEKLNICLVALNSFIKYVSLLFSVITNGFDKHSLKQYTLMQYIIIPLSIYKHVKFQPEL